MAFQTMKTMLTQRLRQAGLERAVQAAQVLETANAVLDSWYGAQTSASHAQAVSLRNKQLSIASLDASLRHQLRLRQEDFVRAVNAKLGQTCVESLRLVF